MFHLLAVLLTLFPGFGAGYLVLGRFRSFVIHFLFSAFLGAFVLLAQIFGPPPAPAGMVLAMMPLLVWNIYHAHRLWLKASAEGNGVEAEQERFSHRLAPFMAMTMLALAVFLAIQTFPSMFFEDRPKSRDEVHRLEVETRLDKHNLSYKARLHNKSARSYYHWYDVEPEGYTLEVYLVPKRHFRGVWILAKRIARFTNYPVYGDGFAVYVLNTSNRDALERLVADLSEHRPVDCIDGEDVGVCGYDPRWREAILENSLFRPGVHLR